MPWVHRAAQPVGRMSDSDEAVVIDSPAPACCRRILGLRQCSVCSLSHRNQCGQQNRDQVSEPFSNTSRRKTNVSRCCRTGSPEKSIDPGFSPAVLRLGNTHRPCFCGFRFISSGRLATRLLGNIAVQDATPSRRISVGLLCEMPFQPRDGFKMASDTDALQTSTA